MNLECIFMFCESLSRYLELQPHRPLALITDLDKRNMTNAAFLLGAYMIMRLDAQPEEVTAAFAPLQSSLLSYRDVSPGEQNFHLYLRDCWEGLWRARQEGLVDFSAAGSFDAEEYAELDNPLNADIHEVVPGKFLAMKGPRALDHGVPWQDRADGVRDFSPAHYAAILQQFGTRAVVRLNDPEYTAEELEAAGIAVVDLYFDDCSVPPPDVAVAFLMIAEAVPGPLAVHCKAGLGRTGTLVGLYLMKHHGFTARQALGWLRVVRPGSVIGEQQRYLCEMEGPMRRAAEDFRRRGGAAAAGDGVAGVYGAVERVSRAVEGMFRQAAARHGRRLTPSRSFYQESDLAGQGASSRLAEHVSLAAAARSAARSRQAAAVAGRGHSISG